MKGPEFLDRYGGISNTPPVVHPGRRYPVRRASEHPVGEQARVDRFARLLPTLGDHPDAANELGQLMYASHRSYSACGLGSTRTRAIGELGRAAGLHRAQFAAKTTRCA